MKTQSQTVDRLCIVHIETIVALTILLLFLNIVFPHDVSSSTQIERTSAPIVVLDPPTFSHTGGFFTEAFNLTLSHADSGVQILFTLDGSIPDLENLEGRTYTYKNQYPRNSGDSFGALLAATYRTYLYMQPLAIFDRSTSPDQLTNKSSTFDATPTYLPQQPVFKGTVVRARAVKNGSVLSPVQTHTFFVTPEGRARYQLPVVALTMQPDTLFQYDNGIYTAGVTFDAWRAENPDGAVHGGRPANWNRDTEFEAHIELLEPADPKVVFGQDLGFRIHGSWTRSFPMKSLRLYARDSYGGTPDFSYPFFPDQPYAHYRRVLLRNAGNDNAWTMFRDAAIQTSVAHLNFDTQAYRPVIVFLNGEYWGIHNLRERYDEYYLARVYGVDPDSVDLLELNNQVEEGDNRHYSAMIAYIQTHDLTEQQHYEYIKTQMDVESFTDYQISQIFVRNTDWPGNNIKYWRLKTDAYTPDSPYGHDGRWRWLMYDTDAGLGLQGGETAYAHNTLAFATAAGSPSYANPDWSTFLLRNLLKNQTFRYNFINRFSDLMNTTFLPNRLDTIIQALQQNIALEMPEHIARWKAPNSMSSWNEHVNTMRTFIHQRPAYQRQHIRDQFGIPGDFLLTIDVSDPKQGYVRVNTISVLGSTPGVSEVSHPREATEAVKLSGGTPQAQSASELLHYWFFGRNLPNDTPLERIDATYSALPGGDPQITFASALIGYPFQSTDPNWRKASLERRNAPTELNYRSEGNEDKPYDSEAMRGIQVKQPFAGDGGENILTFHLPTTGYRDVVFRFAAKDEGAAESLLFDYTTSSGEPDWTTEAITPTAFLEADYQLYTLDFTAIEAVDDNANFKIRLRFIGPNMEADDGDRVTFNNISLDGVPIVINPPYRIFLPSVCRTGGYMATPYPWEGIYFQGIPIELEAIPAPGYRFAGWQGLPESTLALTVQTFTEDVTLKALFVVAP